MDFTAGGQRFHLLILKHIAEDTLPQPAYWEGARPLLLYASTANEKRELLLRNDSLVMCQGCGGIFGDPYTGVEFLRDTLMLRHYGGSSWRWSITHGFVHGADGTWPLVRLTEVSYSVFEPDSTMQITNALPTTRATLATCRSEW